MVLVDTVEFQILDGVIRYSADDGTESRRAVVAGQVADEDPSHGANPGRLLRAAQASAEADEDWRSGDIAHRDVRDSDVFAKRAVLAFQSQSVAGIEDAVGDSDVFEAA